MEWEFVANLDMSKNYPGGRLPIKIDMFLYAVKVEGYNVELDNAPLDECETLITCLTGTLPYKSTNTDSAPPTEQMRTRNSRGDSVPPPLVAT